MRNNGSRRGSKKERDFIEYEGGRMTRNGLSANHLLNFTLPEREKTPAHAGRKKKSVATRTQMEYLHANYRFVIAPLADDTAVSCWDLETLTEWNSVEQVLLWDDEASPATCPICLDALRAPKITRCGHVFCWPCILRYLSLSDKYWRRCPMCFDAVQKGQLRSVRLESVQLPPRADSEAAFQLLQRPKASLFPHIREHATHARLLPTVDDAEAKYARILEATREYVLQLALGELRDLEALDAECRSAGDVDSLPFVEEAMKATSQRLAGHEATTVDAPSANRFLPLLLDSGDSYSFYQLDNGCNVVLHPLNVKCLAREFGNQQQQQQQPADATTSLWVGSDSGGGGGGGNPPVSSAYEGLPDVVRGRVLDVEHLVMDDEVQKRYRFLSHLPKFCDLYVCELDLAPLLSPETLTLFRPELKKREKQRKAKRDKDRRRPTTSPASPVLRHVAMPPSFSLDGGASGAAAGGSSHWPAPAEVSLADAFHDGLLLSESTSSDDAMPLALDHDASFATITRNSGYYPPLGGDAAVAAPMAATWGSSTALSYGVASPPMAGARGGGKKKLGKGTPLFSTAQRRSYR